MSPAGGGAALAARPARVPARPAPAPRRAALELVAPVRRRAGRTPFVVVVVTLLATGLLGLLALNTLLAQDAFRLHTLKEQARTLEEREQALQREVEALRAPQSLAARAGALGMVQAGPPAFLRLPDGAVLGAASPAAGGPAAGPAAPATALPAEEPVPGAEPAPDTAPAEADR